MQSGACPTYFRVGCQEASRGGKNTYADAAWHLAIHLEELAPDEVEPQQWDAMQDELQKALDDEDAEAVFAWFRKVLPRCMELVPYRRKDQFFEGIKQAYQDDRLFV